MPSDNQHAISLLKPLPGFYRLGTVVVAAILILAASLKIHQTQHKPLQADSWRETHLMPSVTACVEFMFAAVLLSRVFPRIASILGVVLFLIFTAVSGHQMVDGKSTCGCFGEFSVSPNLIFLVDSVVVAFFFFAIKRAQGPWIMGQGRGRCILCIVLVFASIGLTRFSMSQWQTMRAFFPDMANADSLPYRTGEFIKLNPKDWVGKQFPLQKFLVGDLTRVFADDVGTLRVILYRRNCKKCHEILKEKLSPANASNTPMLLIEIDGKEPPQSVKALTSSMENIVFASLTRNYRWIVDPPVVLTLRKQMVADVTVSPSSD